MNTLQKTLVLKKQAELDEVDKQLAFKQQEFKSCLEALAQRRSQQEKKQQQVTWNHPKLQHKNEGVDFCHWQHPKTVFLWGLFTQTKERAIKFEKFVAENEVKRRRALKKYEAAREQNISKQREIEDLTEQLKQLRAR